MADDSITLEDIERPQQELSSEEADLIEGGKKKKPGKKPGKKPKPKPKPSGMGCGGG